MPGSLALQLPMGFPPADAVWVHEDQGGVSAAAARGLARAERGDWASGTEAERVGDFRALLVLRAWLAAGLGGMAAVNGEGGALGIAPAWDVARNTPGNDRARAIALIGKTAEIYARAAASKKGSLRGWTPAGAFKTIAGAPPEADTGALPLVVIAVVTVIVAVAESAAVAYCAHEAKALVADYLARDQNLKDLARVDAQVLRVLDEHGGREKEAGQNLPLDDAEKRALGMLETQQAQAEKHLGVLSQKEESGLPWWLVPVSVAAAVGAAIIFGK